MNKVILMGRLCADPEKKGAVSFNLAVDRRYKKEGEPAADFIRIVCFGKQGDFAEGYLRKGTKILVEGRIQTGSYTNKEGQKVYTTDVIADNIEFAESKKASENTEERREEVWIPTDQMQLPFE